MANGLQSQDTTNDWLLSFANDMNSYASDYIKFADQKAAFIMGLITAILALLYEAGIHDSWLIPLSTWRFTNALAFAAFGFNIIAGFNAIVTVLPRLSPTNPQGIIFWKAVAKYKTPTEYETEITSKSKDDIVRELLQHYHSLSRVCTLKYRYLNIAIRFGAVGISLSLLAAILT